MAELKTKPTAESVKAFIQAIVDDGRRQDCLMLAAMMARVTGAEPTMWSSGIIGFGSYRYKYVTGREGDWFEAGFASRKANIAVYVVPGLDRFEEHLSELGAFKTGKGCIYIRRLADVDLGRLEALLTASVALLKQSD